MNVVHKNKKINNIKEFNNKKISKYLCIFKFLFLKWKFVFILLHKGM